MNSELSLISIQVNLLALCYVVLKRSIRSCCKHQYNGTSKSGNCVMKPFPCEEIMKYRKLTHRTRVVSRAFINSIICTLIFGFALNILFTTDIICYPFAGVSQKLYFGSSLMISLCIFNFVLSLSAFRKKRSLFHHCCRYLVAMTVLCNTLYTDQMPVCALIVMLIVGSVSTDEVKELHKLLRDDAAESRGSNLYSMFLFVHLLLNYLCQMLLPVMVVALAMANTRQSFQDMYTVSQTIFFLSSAFLLWYSIWRLRRITIAYSNEKSRINARKMVCRMEGRSAVSGIANMDMFSSASGTPGRSSSTAIPMESSSSANPFENVNVFKTKDNVYEPSFTF